MTGAGIIKGVVRRASTGSDEAIEAGGKRESARPHLGAPSPGSVVTRSAESDADALLGIAEPPTAVAPRRAEGTAGVAARGGPARLPAADDVAARQPVTHVVTDTEGMRGRVDALVAQGRLRIDGDRLDFVNPNDRFVFAGDLTDRGPNSIQLTRWMSDLHARYPDRVTLIQGNRDINKLGLMRDLPQLEGTPTGGYADWLARRGTPADNTLANRVDYWLSEHSASQAFEFHRAELSAMRGTEVTRDQAAEDYVRRMMPGGEFFDYLRRGQLAHIDGPTIYNHSGLADTNIGFVPGSTQRHTEPRQWVTELNAWHRQQIEAMEAAYRAQGAGRHIPGTLPEYGDALWDPTVGAHGKVFAHDASVAYGPRSVEDGNFRVPTTNVRDFLARGGIRTEVVGHSPAGDVPTPLRTPGYLRMMADTSFSGDGAWTTMSVDARGGVRVSGTTRNGDPIMYRSSPDTAPPVGHITDDGYTVIGRNRDGDGGTTRYVVGKYYNGFLVDQRVMSREDLMRARPRPAELTEGRSAESLAHRDLLVANLRERGKDLRNLGDNLDDIIGDRRPIVFSGASKYAQFPASEETLQREVATVMDRIDPRRAVIFTGGTDNGVERMVHAEARRRGIPVIGFIQEGAIPREIEMVNNLVLAGARDQWSDPLLASLNVARERQGMAVFIGGGGVVRQGIDAAEEMGLRNMLMRPGTDITGDGGASGIVAATLPSEAVPLRTFGTATDLDGVFTELGVRAN